MLDDFADMKMWKDDRSSKNRVDRALGSERLEDDIIYYKSNLQTGKRPLKLILRLEAISVVTKNLISFF